MRLPQKAIYLFFFVSGFTGLVYEIVWGRLLVLTFGSTTNSFVAVISAFLAGLAIGSFVFGKIADKYSSKQLINAYSLLEAGIGIFALITIILIPRLNYFYSFLSDGSSQTFTLLIAKFLLTAVILLPPTILMGATLPTITCFVKSQSKSLARSISYLYAVNTLGAVFGVILSAYFLIEIFGLVNTIIVTAEINFALALFARFIKINKSETQNQKSINQQLKISKRVLLLIIIFSISGLVNVAYEILWARILTPPRGTFVYAFATVLAIYLLGIGLGSLIYSYYSKIVRSRVAQFAICEMMIGLLAILSLYTNHKFTLDRLWEIAFFLLPATVFMGLTFPVIISLIDPKKNEGKIVGYAYFGNTIGSILGGFIASFALIRFFGSPQSILLLSILNFAVAIAFLSILNTVPRVKYSVVALNILIIGIAISVLIFKNDRLYDHKTTALYDYYRLNGYKYSLKEDEVATTLAYANNKRDQGLIIDGVATTAIVLETKIMAHLPIALHPDPKSALVIAFGMGSSFKSALAHDVETKAVELVPTVPQLMPFFHKNAEDVLKNPKGKVIINDGRNFAFLTRENYDIVIIDPPPPFNAAGTTVLHSREFYSDLKKHLNKNGIVAQWIYYYNSNQEDIEMALRSLYKEFNYLSLYKIDGGTGGIFVQASMDPIRVDQKLLDRHLVNKKVSDDLSEIKPGLKLSDAINYMGDKNDLISAIGDGPTITDANPKTEYFYIRHKLTKKPMLTGDAEKLFIERLGKKL